MNNGAERGASFLDVQAERALKGTVLNATIPGPVQPLEIITIEDFLRKELPPREHLLAPWLPRQGLAMIHAYRGIGKTHVALAVGLAVASGGCALGWKAPSPAGVLLLDGEMPGPALQERLAAIVASSDSEVSAPFKIMTPDLQPKDRAAFNLAEVADQEALETCLKGIDLIIVDNLATIARSGKSNDAESWLPIQEWALRQRASGRSVLFIHHSGKSGAQRGTSAKEDVLDTVIGLRRPSDYEQSQGARFEIHFEKTRGFSGKDADPLEVALVSDSQDSMTWTVKPLEDALFDRVIELHKEGLSQKEIAEEVQRDKSRISRMLKRARDEGRVND
ncbi:MAG: AAA family ATPase [Gammaproteobacteria bacterium]|nr:AAA family ATPase [Gammaproteobacteria bacterium]